MKKILSFVMAFCLMLCCAPLLTACNEEENKYWLTTHEKFDAFITTDYAKYENGFDLGSKIDTIIDGNYATYYELKEIYTPVFTVSYGIIKNYQNCFSIKPWNNTKQVEQSFASLNEKLDTMVSDLKNFSEVSVPKFVDGVKGSSQEDAENIISLQFLKEFKREYIDLSTNVINFAEELLNLYVMAYQDIPQLYDGENYAELADEEIQNYTRIALSKSVIYSLRPAISYINSFDGTYVQYIHDYYIDIINSYLTITSGTRQVSATAQTLYAFTYLFESYKNDLAIFDQAIASIDMPTLAGEDYNFDAYEYSKGNHQNYANASKVLMFSEDSVYVLKEALLNLYSF